MQGSFINSFNKMLEMHKTTNQEYRNKIDYLRDEFASKMKSLEKDDNSRGVETFVRKLQSLENAIRSITLRPQVVRVQNNNNENLVNSFNGILQRLESLIRESKPRMYPSPS